jgi:hypothetical protein
MSKKRYAETSSTMVRDSMNNHKCFSAINKLKHMSERVLWMKWFYLLFPQER